MRALLLLAALAPATALADLYRWVDPQSGSVKFSSLPPPWYGDPERERRAPAVEVVPFHPGGVPPRAEKPAPARSPLAALEARWRSFLAQFSALASTDDFERAGRGIQKHLEAYQALAQELDRLDPGGAERRRAEEAGVLARLQKGLEAQLGRRP